MCESQTMERKRNLKVKYFSILMSSQRSICRETSSSLSFWLQTVFLRLLGRPTRRAVDAGLNSCCCYTSTLSDWSSSCGSTEDNVTHNKDNTQLLQSSLHINTSGRRQRVGRPSRSTVLHWLTLLPPWLHRATPVPGSLQTKQLGQIWFEYEGLSGDTLIRKLQNQIHRSEHCAGVCGVKWPTGYKKKSNCLHLNLHAGYNSFNTCDNNNCALLQHAVPSGKL